MEEWLHCNKCFKTPPDPTACATPRVAYGSEIKYSDTCGHFVCYRCLHESDMSQCPVCHTTGQFSHYQELFVNIEALETAASFQHTNTQRMVAYLRAKSEELEYQINEINNKIKSLEHYKRRKPTSKQPERFAMRFQKENK